MLSLACIKLSLESRAKDRALEAYSKLLKMQYFEAKSHFDKASKTVKNNKYILEGLAWSEAGLSAEIVEFNPSDDEAAYAYNSENDGNKVQYIKYLYSEGRTNEIKPIFDSMTDDGLKEYVKMYLERERGNGTERERERGHRAKVSPVCRDWKKGSKRGQPMKLRKRIDSVRFQPNFPSHG